MEARLGSPIGFSRRATIRKFNADGTVTIALDEGGFAQQKLETKATILWPWAGQEGEFLGGRPRIGSTVYAFQAHGGGWLIPGFSSSDGVFGNSNTLTQSNLNNNLMAELKSDRILAQVKGGTRFFLDPKTGFHAGNSDTYTQLDPITGIASHTFKSELVFTEAKRLIDGIIKRDLVDNSKRNILYSTLTSHQYDASLFSIGLDPTTTIASSTSGVTVRNPPLVETRELTYEFAQSYQYTNDLQEAERYGDPAIQPIFLSNSRRDMRADALSLSLEYPNHLIETIKGTVVDAFGNILDLNRAALPIGTVQELSFKNNTDKEQTFKNIRKQLRKSIAYHFELNARKETVNFAVPNVDTSVDYARERSRFSLDIDKEGQFKINIPSSSESGNIPLHTRHENYSVLISKQNSEINPNSFTRSENNQDIYLESMAPPSTISLVTTDNQLDGYQTPTDRLTDIPINYGMIYHDITRTCHEFLKSAEYLKAGMKLVNFDPNNRLNNDYKPLEKIVSDKITVSGDGSNAGGRSGSFSADGFISVNVGANTIDRQSMWMDFAGSVISNLGRDKNGISYAAKMDGDLIIQVGGPGISNTFDSRFNDQVDSYRNGAVDIRVLANGQIMILRLGPEGISLISPGTITLSSQQDMIFRSNADIKFEAENIVMYAESAKRMVNRYPNDTI